MRLKQYLRGLGIGIIVTALVIGISSSQKSNHITEEEIKIKASELGMVEGVLDAEATENTTESVIEDEVSMQPSEEFQEEAQIESQEELFVEPQEESVVEAKEELLVEPQEESTAETQEIVIVAIERGDSSNMVASTLERLQVIDDANLFDEYLCSNEYAKKIRIGVYEIPMESSYEEVMNIICGIE